MKKRLAFRKTLFTGSFVRDYGLPVVVSFVLHLLVLGFLTNSWSDDSELKIVPPRNIKASLVELEQPKPAPAPKNQPRPRPEDDAAKKARKLAEQKRKQDEARKKAEQQRQKEIALKKAREAKEKAQKEEEARKERERQKKLEQEKAKKQQEELRKQLQQEQARREREQAAAEVQAQKDASEVVYYAGLFEQLVAQNWNRPLSARNNMTALLQVALSPYGDLMEVRLLEGSGNDAFDRSAIQAVRSAAPFHELKKIDRRIFNDNFRRFNFRFRPEDLVR